MDFEGKGELVPVGGGDLVPLLKSPLIVGRRESCDVQLDFPNVSGKHCELSFREGFWIVQDLNSTNGVKVNGDRVQKKVLHSGDAVTIGKRPYTIQYHETGRRGSLEDIADELEEVMDIPLLEKAGLAHPPRQRPKPGQKRPPIDPMKVDFGEDDDD